MQHLCPVIFFNFFVRTNDDEDDKHNDIFKQFSKNKQVSVEPRTLAFNTTLPAAAARVPTASDR